MFDLYVLRGKLRFHILDQKDIEILNEVKPVSFHLHNPFGYHKNVEALFGWLIRELNLTVEKLHDVVLFEEVRV